MPVDKLLAATLRPKPDVTPPLVMLRDPGSVATNPVRPSTRLLALAPARVIVPAAPVAVPESMVMEPEFDVEPVALPDCRVMPVEFALEVEVAAV